MSCLRKRDGSGSGIEKRGGIALDGPNNLGPLESDGMLPAYICQECRKIIMEY